jgi:hypothetical protein
MAETKQEIKERLLRHASVFWGLPETPAESNFDPLVGLLFGACSTELEKISTDIEDSRARILERLVHLLFPEVLTTGIPAHGIAHAIPLESRLLLPAKSAFYVRESDVPANGKPAGDIYFTPVMDTTLCNAFIAYMATPQNFYKLNGSFSKQFLQTLNASPTAQQTNSVWIGIQRGENVLPGCSFYFELRNEAFKYRFYEQLHTVQWTIDGKKQATTHGYFGDDNGSSLLNPSAIVEGNHNATRQVTQSVKEFYKQQFVTISHINAADNKVLPEFLPAIRLANGDKKELDNLLWVRLDFPGTIPISWLEEINIGLNCFPVINRRQYKLQQRLSQFVNIVPLQPDTFFFDLDSIIGEDGEPIPQNLHKKDSLGVDLRYSGTGRFSDKEAVAAIENMLQQIKDESSAYAVIGNDFLLSELTLLQQILNNLQNELVRKQLTRGISPHLIFSGKKDNTPVSVFISYWGSQGEQANGIKKSTPMLLLQDIDINNNTCFMVTGTTGGRDPLNENQKILAYKAALLSKEKLVTREDIISFCKMRMGIEEGRYTIESGFAVSHLSNKSFSKTIDIKIELPPREKEKLRARGEIAFSEKDLAEAVTARSNFFMPVRVYIK